MAEEPKPLVIKDFRVGIGPSPNMGFGDMRNLDITTRPGVARINYASILKSGTAFSDYPIQIVRDPINDFKFFALDASGVLYRSDDNSETWYVLPGAPTGGVEIAIWQDYLIHAKALVLNTYGSLNSSATSTWNLSWQTIQTDPQFHPMLTSLNDGKLYGGAGHYVFSIGLTNPTGVFSPTGGATSYDFTAQAFTLPGNTTTGEYYRIKCLEELGSNLMIGTDYAQSNQLNRDVIRDGVVFPWDRFSTTYEQPMIFNKNGVNQMKNANQVLYVNAGVDAKYYKSNGIQYSPVAEIPNQIVNLDAGRFLVNRPNAMIQFEDKVYFGLNVGATGADIGGVGVWSVDPNTNALTFEHRISTGNMGDASAVRIGALLPFAKDRLMIGWKDGATAGIDITGTGRYGSYAGYLDSPYYQVGNPLVKRQFTQLEFQLTQPLATGQGVKISYRTDLSAAYTVIDTFDFTLLGAVASHNAVAEIPDCEFVQLRVELTCAGTNTSPQLRTVTLR